MLRGDLILLKRELQDQCRKLLSLRASINQSLAGMPRVSSSNGAESSIVNGRRWQSKVQVVYDPDSVL